MANISKEDLELKKLMLEIEELQKKTKRRVFNIIVIVVIAIPTIWFYYKEFAEPFMQIDKIGLAEKLIELKDEYDNKLKKLMSQKEAIENDRELLAKEKIALEKEYLELNKQKQKQETEFQAQLKDIRNSYNRLSSLYQTKTKESQDVKRKVDLLNNQIKEKDKIIKDLDKDIKEMTRRSEPEEFKSKKRFRTLPANLSFSDVKEIILRNNFYDNLINQNSKGFPNQYKVLNIQHDKIIFDGTTGLMWQQGGSDYYMDYEDAKRWIAKLNQKGYAGYKDWRLPTLEEAMSLMEPEPKNDLYIDPIFDSKQTCIWTANQAKGESRAWVVYFDYGRCHWYPFRRYGYVRAVRSGQSFTE